MAFSHEFGASTHTGLVRSNNEDNYLADPTIGLWLVVDGMGGHDAGEVASQIVRDSVNQAIKNRKPLNDAILQSHFDVQDAANNNIGSPNMGTTIVALQSLGENYKVAWVGDSRAYLWDNKQHQLKQLSKDHSYVQSLVDAGLLKPEEMNSHPQKNVITQSLGISVLETVTVDSIEGQWSPEQKILLCSDGLTDLVSDMEIAHILRKYQHKTPQEISDILIETALSKGGIDNVTVEVINAPNLAKSADWLSWQNLGLAVSVLIIIGLSTWALF